MRPGAGAFAPPPVEAENQAATPRTTPADTPQDPAQFLQHLQQMGLINGAPPAAPARAHGGQIGKIPTPPNTPDPIAQLSSMTGQNRAPGPQGTPGTLATPATPPRPTKSRFVPGKPGAPKSGMTAHQMMRDAGFVSELQSKVSAWEAENPGRKLMGPHVQSMLPDVSPAQARTLLRLINKMASKETDLAERYQRGAYNAMK